MMLSEDAIKTMYGDIFYYELEKNILEIAVDAFDHCAPHYRDWVKQYGTDVSKWPINQHDFLELARVGLLKNWESGRSDEQKSQVKRALQYVLNHDEKLVPRLRRNDSVSDEIFAAKQDFDLLLMDGYDFCKWAWLVLYGNDDWQLDVTSWTDQSKGPASRWAAIDKQ
jgi:hypothetical protein